MSRFRKLSQTLWHCQYHIVWCPKYRFRVFEGEIKGEAEECIKSFTEVQKCELLELNIQVDHVHLLVMIPPKVSISSYVGTVKGRTAIRILWKHLNFAVFLKCLTLPLAPFDIFSRIPVKNISTVIE